MRNDSPGGAGFILLEQRASGVGSSLPPSTVHMNDSEELPLLIPSSSPAPSIPPSATQHPRKIPAVQPTLLSPPFPSSSCPSLHRGKPPALPPRRSLPSPRRSPLLLPPPPPPPPSSPLPPPPPLPLLLAPPPLPLHHHSFHRAPSSYPSKERQIEINFFLLLFSIVIPPLIETE